MTDEQTATLLALLRRIAVAIEKAATVEPVQCEHTERRADQRGYAGGYTLRCELPAGHAGRHQVPR